MEQFVSMAPQTGGGRAQPYSDFRLVLEQVASHPNRPYFIYKSIIISNLYGVDIMDEAVEICKLRLFLKLAAQLESVDQIEPLPDIDFNIRAGNSLIGYTSFDDVRRATEATGFDFDDRAGKIEAAAQDLDKAFDLFRQQQTNLQGSIKADHKSELRSRLCKLGDQLDRFLAKDYGLKVNGSVASSDSLRKWKLTYKPFHWLIEFYGTISSGGFDAIIGNPPYVELKKVSEYTLLGFATRSCGDLYACMVEKALQLTKANSYQGMIVPISIVSTEGFKTLRRCVEVNSQLVFYSNFAERPSKLFNGVEKRLTIYLLKKIALNAAEDRKIYSSKYNRWAAEERDTLFEKLSYLNLSETTYAVSDSISKLGDSIEQKIQEKIAINAPLDLQSRKNTGHIIYYTRKLRYFIQFFDFTPKIYNNENNLIDPSELKKLCFDDQAIRDFYLAALNSSLFFWFFCSFSDVRNVNKREIDYFPCDAAKASVENLEKMSTVANELMQNFEENSEYITNNYKKYGTLSIQTFKPRLAKPIIDEIDKVLAVHYGFTDEELDFIINYDIKYRVGASLEDEG